jgi:hypothetical protein
MATVTAIRKDEGNERGALRHAVSAAAKARAAVAAHHAAIERAQEHVAEAVGNVAAASAAVNTARQDHAKQIASVITGGGSPTATGLIRAARAHERDAEDELAALKEALGSLQADLADLETDVSVAGRAVDAALAEMLKPVATRLLEEARAHHLRFLTTREALNVVGRSFNPWDGGELTKQIDRVGTFSEADVRVSIATRQQWLDAIEALKMDAGAPLPG